MPRQPEPSLEISESVSRLCSFDAVGGSIAVKVIQDSRPIHDKMVDSFLEQIFSIRVATYPAQATAVSWILKDGMKHAGKLIYSSMGAKMDSEPKSWRILADVLYDLGTALEVISPLCPQLFLEVAGLGNFAKGMAVVAARVRSLKIYSSFAKEGNLSDLFAEGRPSQHFSMSWG